MPLYPKRSPRPPATSTKAADPAASTPAWQSLLKAGITQAIYLWKQSVGHTKLQPPQLHGREVLPAGGMSSGRHATWEGTWTPPKT